MFFIVVLSFVPVVIWSFMEPLGFRFFDANSITTSLGQIFGLVGMTLFSINLIMSGRFKFLDKYFKGLDKVYLNHSRIGSIAFSLILFHPIFLVIKYLSISTREAGLFFVPFLNMPITWGIISLLLMMILIILTFYIKLKYNVWKMSHKFMTVAFLFGIIHVFFISSDVSRSSLLNYYILSLAFVGLFVSARQAFLSKFSSKKLKYKVKNVKILNENILEIEMEAFNNKMIFNPGQFAFFSFFSEGIKSESHPFSISSGTNESNLKITVKNLGDYTSLLKKLRINDKVLVHGPYGNFTYKSVPNKNQIWIAGGIGITPFLSMAKSLEPEYNVDLYYSTRNYNEAVYINIFRDISQKISSFRFNPWTTDKNGYINCKSISDLSKGLNDKEIFLCGPSVFMESLKDQFLSLGVGINKIHYENFNF